MAIELDPDTRHGMMLSLELKYDRKVMLKWTDAELIRAYEDWANEPAEMDD